MVDKVVELGAEELFCPELLISVFFSQACGSPVANLIVENDGDTVLVIEVFQRQEVFVAGAWAAVEGDQGRGGGFEIADYAVPCLAGLIGGGDIEGDEAFLGYLLCHVVCVWVVASVFTRRKLSSLGSETSSSIIT